MRNRVFHTVLLFGLSSPLAAQVNGFIGQNARWHVAETSSANIAAFIETWTTTYGTVGDTLIDGLTWYPVVSSPNPLLLSGTTHEGYVRQAGETVLYMAPGSAPDTLYDFAIELGDSVRYLFAGFPGYLHVEAIDTLWIGGQAHRRYHFAMYGAGFCYLADEQWIEGIGSIHGPLFPLRSMEFCAEFHESLTLTCYEQDGMLHWMHPGFTECSVNILLSTSTPWGPVRFQMAWPNPGTDRIWFDLPIGSASPKARVYDACGVLALEALHIHPGAGLDVGRLARGLYTIVLTTGENERTSMRWAKE